MNKNEAQLQFNLYNFLHVVISRYHGLHLAVHRVVSQSKISEHLAI